MAYPSRRRPSASASVRSDFQEHDLNASPVSPASYMPASDRHEYSDDHIKILYDIVVRAEDLLPTLPEAYRRPIPALLKAYNEVLPEYGIHPEDDQQITKLVFKVGGVFGRGSLMDKFRTVLSRMNITIELDVPSLRPGDAGDDYADAYSTSDGASISRGAAGRHAREYDDDDGYPSTDNGRDDSNAGETTDEYTIPKDELYTQLDENDSYTIPRSEPDVHLDDPVGKVPLPVEDAEAAQSRIEQNLEYSAIAFHDRYHAKFSVLDALRQWQRQSEEINVRWDQYRAALEADMVGVVEDTFRAWRILSAEAEEVPPPYLPSNIYSKRTEQIAARTYQIFATKNAFARWRRRAKERCRRCPPQEIEEEEPLDPMERVALKAHENLMLSRAFVRWFNRSTQEAKKARMAAKVYEMSLKSKTFGRRHRLDETLLDSMAPMERVESATTMPDAPVIDEEEELFDEDSRSAEMHQKAEMARKYLMMRSLAKRAEEAGAPGRARVHTVAATDEGAASDDDDESYAEERQHTAQLTQQLSSIRALAARSKKGTLQSDAPESTKGKAKATDSGLDKPVADAPVEKTDDEKLEDELDERTMLARRHILRMRIFNAWESYTSSHVTKVKEFAFQKTVEPWRERAAGLRGSEYLFSRDRQKLLLLSTITTWAQTSNGSKPLEEKAESVERKLRVQNALKPWIAASREKRKILKMKSWAFDAWFDHEDDDAVLHVMASQEYCSQRTKGGLKQWRVAKDNESARTVVFKVYSDRAVYYYNTTGALRTWKAAAREAAILKSMKIEALEMWQNFRQGELSRQEKMESLAEGIDFSYSAGKTLPVWRAKAKLATEVQQKRQTYATKADYYYKTKEAILVWRTSAEAKHKRDIKKAHSEARRRVKKGMGERCIARWRLKLQPSFDRFEAMNSNLEKAVISHEWQRTGQVLDAWRARALERARSTSAGEARAKQKRDTLTRWRDFAAERRLLTSDAAGHLQDRAAARAIRGWGLAALQRTGRVLTVTHVQEKRDRRLLRHGLERWCDRAAVNRLLASQREGQQEDLASTVRVAEDARQNEATQDQARRRLFLPHHTWHPAADHANMNAASVNANATVAVTATAFAQEDREVYVPTPGRPRLPLLGALSRPSGPSTTPLAPVPSRTTTWRPAGPPSSVMRGSELGASARASASRSRRNLRVSWAQ
ncbi:hypothetical protein DL763_001897 [Monosporascus cannonballus]|nr:hypothetical protein DL763_001897 [Monosporascus cannonballus]